MKICVELFFPLFPNDNDIKVWAVMVSHCGAILNYFETHFGASQAIQTYTNINLENRRSIFIG